MKNVVSFFCPLLAAFIVFGAAVGSAESFDHHYAGFDQVLKLHVRDSKVDYAALKKSPQALDAYLDESARVPENDFNAWSENERLAFLINLYNAATLKLIVDHYPVKSIRSIGWLPGSAWKQERVRLFGKKISLDELEHGIIRGNYREPRVHFALVCAALGCPPLREEVFVGDQLDRQLEDQGKKFFSNTSKNRVDATARVVYLSPIFKWFAEDFEAASGSVVKFVTPFFPDEAGRALASGEFKVSYTDYDWSLNDQGKK